MGARTINQHVSSPIRIVLCGAIISLYCLVADVYCAQQQNIHDLFSVTFPSETQGWACGRFGTILHGTEGGSKWTVQKSGTRRTLTQIHFVDIHKGWAVGDKGTILHTADGGQNWVKQESPVDLFLMGVHFVDAEKGWAVGERTTILHTADGGKTWQIQFSGEDYYLKRVSFCDDQNGWAVGEFGYTYHTVDGGANWVHQAGFFGISDETGRIEGDIFRFDVLAVDPMTAWVVGIDGYIRKTLDGGETWQAPTQAGSVPGQQIFAIASAQDRVYIGGNRLLLASSDGGQTFNEPDVQPPVKYGWIYDIGPRGNAGLVAVGKGGWIYLSDAAGNSWQRSESR